MTRLPAYSQADPSGLARLFMLGALFLPALLFHPRILHSFNLTQEMAALCLAPLPLIVLLAHRTLPISNVPQLRPLAFVFLGFLFWSLLAALVSERPALGVQWFIQITAALALLPAAFYLARKPSVQSKLAITILLVTAIQVLAALLQWTGLDPFAWTTTFEGRPGALFGNPNFLAGHLTLVLPLILALALSGRRSKLLRTFSWALFAAACLVLFATQTRGALLAAGVGLALMAWLCRRAMPGLLTRNRRPALITFIIIASVAIAGLAQRPQAFQRLAQTFQGLPQSVHQRLVLIQNTLRLASQNPLVGIGPGQLRLHYHKVQAADLPPGPPVARDYIMTSHAHNDLAQLAAEGGLPLALLWGSAWFFLFRLLFRSKDLQSSQAYQRLSESRPLLLASLLSGLLALQIHALANFPMLIPATLVTAVVMAGIALRLALPDQNLPITPSKPWWPLPLAAVLLVLMMSAARAKTSAMAMDHFWWVAQGERSQNRPTLALSAARAGLALDASDDRLWQLYALSHADFGRTTEAAHAFEQARQRSPYDATIRLQLARIRMEQGQYQATADLLAPLADHAPNLTGWRNLYGAALFNLQDWNACAQAFEQAVQFEDQVSASLVNQAACLGNSGQFEQAVAALNHALRLDPENDKAMMAKAITYHKMGSKELSRMYLRRALEINPNNAEARLYRKAIEGN